MKDISGLVKDKYCKAPTKAQYSVGDECGAPPVKVRGSELVIGVETGLQSLILALVMMSMMYFL